MHSTRVLIKEDVLVKASAVAKIISAGFTDGMKLLGFWASLNFDMSAMWKSVESFCLPIVCVCVLYVMCHACMHACMCVHACVCVHVCMSKFFQVCPLSGLGGMMSEG